VTGNIRAAAALIFRRDAEHDQEQTGYVARTAPAVGQLGRLLDEAE